MVNSVFFGVYGHALKFVHPAGTDGHLSHAQHRQPDMNHYVGVAVAGGVAGCAQVIVSCPIDVVKVVLQSQLKPLTNRGNV
jgi:Mitochondrial carrier protein